MQLRKMLLGMVCFGSFAASGAAYAQDYVTSVYSNPQDKTFTIRLPDNTIVVADGVSRRFYLQDRTGAHTEISFQDAVNQAEPDPSKRAAMMAAFESALKAPVSAGYGAYPTPYSPPPWCSDSPECYEQSLPGGGDVEGTTGSDTDPDSELPKPVDVDPVVVTGTRPSWGNSSPSMPANYSAGYLGSYHNPGGSVSYQQYWADDYKRFQNRRKDACEDAQLGLVGLGASTVSAGYVCGISVAAGPVGAIPCGAAMVTMVLAWHNWAKADAKCASAYPGPGNW